MITRIKSGIAEKPNLPSGAAPRECQITSSPGSEPAPTLLGGQSAGSQGQVQVWVPQRLRLWAPAIGWGSIAAWGVYGIFVRFSAFPGEILGILGSLFLLPALINLSRPTYLTTDEAGIGITTLSGTRSLRWSDIRALNRNFPSQCSYASLSLRLNDSIARPGSLGVATTVINLCGYSRSFQDQLTALIVERAGLEPSAAGMGKYVRMRDGGQRTEDGEGLCESESV